MTLSLKEQRICLIGLGGVVALKLVFLGLYGPVHTPDSYGYTGFADWILNETAWRTQLDLKDFWYPPSGFRSIGYPAFIAFCKLITASYYDWLIVFLQSGVSLFVSFLIFKTAMTLQLSFRASLFCAGAHAISLGFLLDQAILTDSLNANILLIATLMMAMGILEKRAPSFQRMLGVGLLIAVAFLIREAGNYLQYLYWPLAAWWIVSLCQNWKSRVVLFLCFIAPMLLFTQTYKTWNQMRTGERFITTAGQTTIFFPVLELKKRGINAFENDPYLKDMPPYLEPLSRVAPLQNIRIINKHLVEEHDFDALDNARYAFKTFFRLWRERPVDMLKVTLSAIKLDQLFMPLSPTETAMTYPFWKTEKKPFFNEFDLTYKVRHKGRLDLLLAYVLRHGERVIACVISLSFLFGVPFMAIKRVVQTKGHLGEKDQPLILFSLFWLIYMGYTWAYAMVNLEQRYLLAVFPLCVLSGVYLLSAQRSFQNEARANKINRNTH